MTSSRPFIATSQNVFDENECIYSPNILCGQPVLVTRDKNKRVCETTTTTITGSQHTNYCSCPCNKFPACQQQGLISPLAPCTLQAQKHDIAGSAVFNFLPPQQYGCCPPSCLASVYTPPPPPSPQFVQVPDKTPQSICVDFGRYGMEAMMFQKKLRDQYIAFTFDKAIGTTTEPAIPKEKFCSCQVEAKPLTVDQKQQFFFEADICGSNCPKLLCVNTGDKGVVCFPKPDSEKCSQTGVKTLIISKGKSDSSNSTHIVEEAEKEGNLEALLCTECLDKWRRDKKRSSCPKPPSDVTKETPKKQTGEGVTTKSMPTESADRSLQTSLEPIVEMKKNLEDMEQQLQTGYINQINSLKKLKVTTNSICSETDQTVCDLLSNNIDSEIFVIRELVKLERYNDALNGYTLCYGIAVDEQLEEKQSIAERKGEKVEEGGGVQGNTPRDVSGKMNKEKITVDSQRIEANNQTIISKQADNKTDVNMTNDKIAEITMNKKEIGKRNTGKESVDNKTIVKSQSYKPELKKNTNDEILQQKLVDKNKSVDVKNIDGNIQDNVKSNTISEKDSMHKYREEMSTGVSQTENLCSENTCRDTHNGNRVIQVNEKIVERNTSPESQKIAELSKTNESTDNQKKDYSHNRLDVEETQIMRREKMEKDRNTIDKIQIFHEKNINSINHVDVKEERMVKKLQNTEEHLKENVDENTREKNHGNIKRNREDNSNQNVKIEALSLRDPEEIDGRESIKTSLPHNSKQNSKENLKYKGSTDENSGANLNLQNSNENTQNDVTFINISEENPERKNRPEMSTSSEQTESQRTENRETQEGNEANELNNKIVERKTNNEFQRFGEVSEKNQYSKNQKEKDCGMNSPDVNDEKTLKRFQKIEDNMKNKAGRNTRGYENRDTQDKREDNASQKVNIKALSVDDSKKNDEKEISSAGNQTEPTVSDITSQNTIETAEKNTNVIAEKNGKKIAVTVIDFEQNDQLKTSIGGTQTESLRLENSIGGTHEEDGVPGIKNKTAIDSHRVDEVLKTNEDTNKQKQEYSRNIADKEEENITRKIEKDRNPKNKIDVTNEQENKQHDIISEDIGTENVIYNREIQEDKNYEAPDKETTAKSQEIVVNMSKNNEYSNNPKQCNCAATRNEKMMENSVPTIRDIGIRDPGKENPQEMSFDITPTKSMDGTTARKNIEGVNVEFIEYDSIRTDENNSSQIECITDPNKRDTEEDSNATVIEKSGCISDKIADSENEPKNDECTCTDCDNLNTKNEIAETSMICDCCMCVPMNIDKFGEISLEECPKHGSCNCQRKNQPNESSNNNGSDNNKTIEAGETPRIFHECTSGRNHLSKMGKIVTTFCTSSIEKISGVVQYLRGSQVCPPRCPICQHICDETCYKGRIDRRIAQLEQPRFCKYFNGKTYYDEETNRWYPSYVGENTTTRRVRFTETPGSSFII